MPSRAKSRTEPSLPAPIARAMKALERAADARVAADESDDDAAFDRAWKAEQAAEAVLADAVAKHGRLIPGLADSLPR